MENPEFKQHIGYKKVFIYKRDDMGPLGKPFGGEDTDGCMMAHMVLSRDIQYLFPFINAVAKRAEFYENPSFIRFVFNSVLCALYPDYLVAAPFFDRLDVGVFAEAFLSFLNDTDNRQSSIQPNYKIFRRTPILEIMKLLPKTNCGECGYKTCMAFAAAVSKQKETPGHCPYVSPPMSEQAAYPVYDAQGNLLSTILLDIDTKNTNKALRQVQTSLEKLKVQVEELSKNRKAVEEKVNECLPSPLSKREIEILRYVAGGATNTEIADLLFISPHTVKSHVNSIFNKLGLNDRTRISVWAAQQGLL